MPTPDERAAQGIVATKNANIGCNVCTDSCLISRLKARPRAIEEPMKIIATLAIASCLMAACVAGSNVSHEDSPAATQHDAGPTLCRDGTTPPCNTRS
jgi:hypothetical protein